MNRDGAYSRGASLPELKGRRNAAGNFPARWVGSLALLVVAFVTPPAPRPAPAPAAPPAAVLAEIRRLEGRAAELRARYCAGRPAYLAVRTFAAPAPAQWRPCGHHAGGGTTFKACISMNSRIGFLPWYLPSNSCLELLP